ncbi:MAG: hypothetical protein IJ681_03225 [Bacteroidales bacterium]|nr:hypothetical protein [Bacteroidales bacterium]
MSTTKKYAKMILITIIIASVTSIAIHYAFAKQDRKAFECYQKGKTPNITLFTIDCPE